MAQCWYNDAGTWRQAKELWYNDAGTWRQAKECWYNDAGTWRKTFSGFSTPSGINRVSSGGAVGTSYAPRISFENDGTATFKNSVGTGTNVAGANWGTPTTTGVGSLYWVKFTNVAGTGTYNGATPGVWTSIATVVTLGINTAAAGNVQQRSGTFQISTDAAGVTIVATGSYSFISDRS